jgi:hypothetical protein
MKKATLVNQPKPGRTVLQVKVRNNAYALCVLQKDLVKIIFEQLQILLTCYIGRNSEIITRSSS